MRFAKTAVFSVVVATLAACGGQPVTHGELLDRDAASDTDRCARQYLGRPNSGPNDEIWIMCVQIVSNRLGRDVVNVAQRIVDKEGWNVFEFENRSGAGREISEQGAARLRSGE